ncbi:MAG: tetratricopeptide repeat protein [Desulfobacula sp.]|jgi:Tfp pilus assembly protein PilF
MKKLCCLLIIFLFTTSCASQNVSQVDKREVAIATQRVGEGFYNAGNYTLALKNLLEAYETLPDDPYLNNSLGLVYLAKEQYALAENHFKKSLESKKDYVDAKNNLGAAYLKQQKWSLAIDCFEDVSKSLVYSNPEIPYSNLGWAYFHMKKYDKANFFFNKSLQINPRFLISIHGLASVYLEIGSYLQAIDFLNLELKREPDAAILHSDIAKAYEGINEFSKAKKSWEIVLKLVPETSQLAREAKQKLNELN